MTDTTSDPAQPTANSVSVPVQPSPVNPPPGPVGTPEDAPAGYIELARYNGLVRKVEELTLANRGLTDQLASKSSEIEQLKGQLAIKDTEKTVAVGERDSKLTTVLQENQTLLAELTELRGLQAKVQAIKELNRPELLKIADRIPAVQDPEALKTILLDFAGFADDLVKQREQQLLAGVTPAIGGVQPGPSRPQTGEAWLNYLNGLPLGSLERTKAFDEYGDWLEKQAALHP
jgi:hypothetical protein